MDFKQIQELIKLINKSNIGEVTIEEKGFKITVKQKEEHVQQVFSATYPAQQSAPSYAPPASASPAGGTAPANGKSKASEVAADSLITIKSPMIGTFYRSSAPDKPSFVNVGDETEPGKVVCIIEAMELFNEIESEVEGRIVRV